MKEYTLSLDYYELLNLHKALLEAKFNSDPDNELVSGSPLVAGVYIQVRDLLMQSDKSDDWKAWFQLKNRPDRRKSAIIRILGDERWEKASDDDKKKIAGNYLAPFIYDEEELNKIVTEIDYVTKTSHTQNGISTLKIQQYRQQNSSLIQYC